MKPEPAPIATPERVAELNAEALRLFRANVQRIQSENGPDGPETLRETALRSVVAMYSGATSAPDLNRV